ncbi:hypothetical protein IOQ59_06000 [Pontibacterium sp. N1Y112]|uniref:Uncharacterized protein n=1 Tax=Pontibacterium sinense TaxID=2781979 RepID=A0A8J7FCD7_9GAMM|nr:hypothetical protein [Pontibacterium sinense]MBE9396814.1 hypothetical protein [Pontibacterium sinense]
MDRFTNRYLNFFEGKRAPRGTSFLWPVWVWEVLAPDASRNHLNLFQRTILGLIQAGKSNADEIAGWMGIEKEMVLYITVSQLQPNGWLDSKGQLTDEGCRLLENDLEARRSLTTAYVFQDVFSLKLWPRVAHSLPYIDPEPAATEGYPVFMANRETGWEEKPFVLSCHVSTPDRPDIRSFWEAVQQGNNAIHNQKVRGELDCRQKEFKADEIDLIEFKPLKAYVFCWAIEDQTEHWAVTDPLAITPKAEFLREEVFMQARKNQGFARKLSKFIGEIPEKETWEEMNRRLAAEVDFKAFTHFNQAHKIPHLMMYLGALLRREQILSETKEDKDIRVEDCNDLIVQAQKVFECCFKWMLDDWPVANKHFIKRNWQRDDIRSALEEIGRAFLADSDLDNLASQKSGSIHHAATSREYKGSLRPLLAATLFTLPSQNAHPLFGFEPEELAISKILDIADARNAVSHASGKQSNREQALECARFTSQWIQTLLGNMK